MRYFFLFASITICALYSCENKPNKEDEAIAQTHCGSCHQFPSPLLLDKTNWEKVLPQMALLLGVKSEIVHLDSLNQFERSTLSPIQKVTDNEWKRIKSFYLSASPYRLHFPLSSTVEPLKRLFKGKVGQTFNQGMPNITCVKIDPNTQSAYVCDEVNREIWVLNKDGIPSNHFTNQAAVSDIQLLNNQLLVTYIGNSINISLSHNGFNQLLDAGNKGKSELLLTHLYRPTQTLSVNLDNEAGDELVTNEFGMLEGSLSVWKKKGVSFEKHVIAKSPGAVKTIAIDYDKVGLIDLITLFGQGDERIVFYKNNGNLNFTETVLLRFPPVYGSSSFEVVDFNKDGQLDIVYTSGDNSDYSVELKPYHGVYIFENKGKNIFQQSFFYHMNGAYIAVARDFDLDGDIDIASIAFYADYFEKTPKDFVYFENNQQKLSPKGLDIKRYGRWLALDAGDIDNDGDDDLILGSHPIGITPGTLLKEWRKSSGALLLINQTKK